jgi:hypothetical protein
MAVIEVLGYSNFFTQWVPQMLTDAHKEARKAITTGILYFYGTGCKGFLLQTVKQSHYRPRQAQEVQAPRFQDSRHMKVVRLSALRIGCLYPPGNIPDTCFC